MSCTSNCRMNKEQRKIRLFQPASTLDFVANGILDHSPLTKSGNKYIVIIANGYLKVSKAIPIAKTKATRIVNIFKEQWVANFGILFRVQTDNGSPLISKIICSTLQGTSLQNGNNY